MKGKIKKTEVSGVARVISLGGGGKKLREVRKNGGPEMRKNWGKNGKLENVFGATPFRTSENAPFWKNILK